MFGKFSISTQRLLGGDVGSNCSLGVPGSPEDFLVNKFYLIYLLTLLKKPEL